MGIPLLAARVVLLGLVGVAAAAACAWESGGAAVDVGEGSDGGTPAPAGRRLLPGVGGAHRRRGRGRGRGRVWLSRRSPRLQFSVLASRALLLRRVGSEYTELRLRR